MKVLPYSKEWIAQFDTETKMLREKLKDIILDIQHIGSTAIPGMSAKPIIDIAVLTPSFDRIDNTIKILHTLGYEYDKSRSSTERYFLHKGTPTQYHLSITIPEVSFLNRQLLFRDYLINHPTVSKDYEQLKLKAIKKYPTGRDGYTGEKDDFIKKILDLAEKEAIE